MDIDTEPLTRAAERAAVRAGRLLLEEFAQGTAARSKPGAHEHDVVTAADLAAEDLIAAELTAAAPGSTVIGEERGGGEGGEGGEERGGDGGHAGEVCWYVDPIDGTHNFSRGIPLWCVSIGLTIRGAPAGGCVYEPVRDRLYAARTGGVLRCNGEVVPASPPRPVPMVLTDVPRPGGVPHPAELALLADLMVAADVRRIGSAALALAYVAAGHADMAVTPDAFAWDMAAGRVLVTAGGGAFAALPDPPSTVRPGAFAAWRPGLDELGRVTVRALKGWPNG
ncbi:inositol monophosphatase [Actinomadura barringtoniae]|uniref:inositol-phosphate phosphatase n=1 Tax=Actinomadura barringtoniae TaxID=1427535 RepID=A0A939PDE0_9ACTN|nr:inositol monophosphatase [Actinomadura barringtoniae]MBO2447199.1 inositol monophosphatase [Actinomadura barringtoniae]